MEYLYLVHTYSFSKVERVGGDGGDRGGGWGGGDGDGDGGADGGGDGGGGMKWPPGQGSVQELKFSRGSWDLVNKIDQVKLVTRYICQVINVLHYQVYTLHRHTHNI